jgi:hypothetical protein
MHTNQNAHRLISKHMSFLDKSSSFSRVCLLSALFTFFLTPILAQDEQDMETYFKRIQEKANAAEHTMNGATSRLRYLNDMLKEDVEELKTSDNQEETQKIKARQKQVAKLHKKAVKLQKKANKRLDQMNKLGQKDNDVIVEHLEELKDWLEEVQDIGREVSNLADQSLMEPNANAEAVIPVIPIEEKVAQSAQEPTILTQTDLDQKSVETEPNEPNSEEKDAKENEKYAKYSKGTDVMFTPPSVECDSLLTVMNTFTGKEQRVTQSKELFHFTNAFMANSLNGKQHITCYASVVTTGKRSFLNLQFVIIDQNASKNFGAIRRDVPTTIKFVNESKLSIANQVADEGSLDASGTVFTVNASFELYKLEKDALRKIEIDKIRIPWAKGFEEYEVYRVDLVQRLLKCL